MHLIVYISDIEKSAGSVQGVIDKIVRVAKMENQKHDITGVFLSFRLKRSGMEESLD